jgi:hypothetical protein
MTTIRQYECNFCKRTIKSGEAFGIYWVADKTMEERPAYNCENHLCEVCFKAIGRLYIQVQEGLENHGT